jgi:hypothetical protein
MPTFFFADPLTSSLMQLHFEGDTQAWQVINHTSTQKGGRRQCENERVKCTRLVSYRARWRILFPCALAPLKCRYDALQPHLWAKGACPAIVRPRGASWCTPARMATCTSTTSAMARCWTIARSSR